MELVSLEISRRQAADRLKAVRRALVTLSRLENGEQVEAGVVSQVRIHLREVAEYLEAMADDPA